FLHLENGSLIMISLLRLPGQTSKEVSVVKGCVVVAPVADMLYCSSAGDGCFPAGRLGYEPIRHVAAVAVAAHSQVIGISNSIFDQGSDAFENVLAGAGDDFGHNLLEKLITVSAGTAVIRLKNQPTLGGGETVPLIPIGFEVIAVRVGGAAVNQDEHGQVLGLKLSRRIHEHA